MLDGAKAQSHRLTLFKWEAKMLQYVQAPHIYHTDPRVKRSKHMSVAEFAIYFWLKGLAASEMLGRVDCISVLHAVSTHPGSTRCG